MKKASFSIDTEKDLHSDSYNGITLGIKRIVKILNKNEIKGTFFVTGEALTKYPQIFKKLNKDGHEIGVHGYSHRRFDSLGYEEKEEEIRECVAVYRRVFNKNPKGFRAPQHSIDKDTIKLLSKYKFRYDSSVCSRNLMLLRHIFRRKSNKIEILRSFFGKSNLYSVGKIIEIPRSSPLLALGGFELKVYPRIVNNLTLFMHYLFGIPLNFTMHSWDMINTPGSWTSNITKADKFEITLDRFIRKAKKDYKFVKMEDLA
jgi:peptidoglycan/xylan/chitin deacetylase (PgdA/CDA1 family)